jgi:hypothetical protein
MPWCRARKACQKQVFAALAQPEPYPLPESLYPDSKDWVASDYVGRVEWLHFMYESKKREVEQLETAQPEQKPLWEQWKCMNEVERKYFIKSWWVKDSPPQRKPLTETQIAAIDWKDGETLHDFARAIEKAHGIGG